MFKRLLKVLSSCGLLVTLLVTTPSSAVSQTVEAWSNLGLYGGQINDIAIDPTNPEKIFAASHMGDGLFLTEDSGKNWRGVETENLMAGEDAFDDHSVWAVKIASSNNSVIWVAHNHWVEKSTDGGQTWSHILNGVMQSPYYQTPEGDPTCPNCPEGRDYFRWCKSLAIDPDDPKTVYVGTSGRSSNLYDHAGAIYKTEDEGKTWMKMNRAQDFDYEVVDLAIDPNNRNIVWAVTDSFGYNNEWAGTLYRSEDGGQTWVDIFTIDGSFYDVEVKPHDSNTIFTGNAQGIFKHYYDNDEWKVEWILNYGGQWPPPSDEVFARQVRALVFDPQNPDVIYAAWKNPWGGDPRGKVAKGTPPYGNADWQIYTVDHEFTTLAVDPTNSEVIFGGEINLGVFNSEDHGQAWTPINEGINAVIIYDMAVDPNDSTHLLAGTISGAYERKGETGWSRLISSSTTSLQFHPTDSLTFYAGLWGLLAKTTDGGLSWAYSNLNIDHSVEDIAFHPVATDTVFVAVGDWILKSTDGGDNFETVLLGENLAGQNYNFNIIAFNPTDPQHIFAGGGNFPSPRVYGDLWESNEGGAQGTWGRTGLTNVVVNALLINPEDPNIMYAGCGYNHSTDTPVYKSADGGITWTSSFEGIPGMPLSLYGVWGSSATDVFAVGWWGLGPADWPIFHYDGNAWTHMDTGIKEDFYGVWGSSGTEVFAVGHNGTILRYDGSSWSPMDSGTTEPLWGTWGTSATDVFAVGHNGTILHYDGSSWSAMDSGTASHLWGTWGTSATDVFATGNSGTILHYNGSAWSAMDSGTTEPLWGTWGSSATDVFAVGHNGTILHYDGSSWSPMDSGTASHLWGTWGTSATDVFATGNGGTILHYNGSAWSAMDSGTTEGFYCIWGTSGTEVLVAGSNGSILRYDGTTWTASKPGGSFRNSVTDLEFHPQDTNVVYASTYKAGVYVSPDQGGNWLNLGTPDHLVSAISTSSLYAATQGGLLQCTGTGILAGQVMNAVSQGGIHRATVMSDLGGKTISINGQYMMVSPSGICDVTATADLYVNSTVSNVTVYGGDVTWVNIVMPPDSHVVEVIPHYNAGIHDSTRVANNTGFAVRIVYSNGVDLTDPASVQFIVNDGVNEYQRDLGHPAVRWQKLIPDEPDTHVTKLWVVYDRCREAQLGNYAYDTTINIRVDVEGTAQATYRFRTETEQEHIDANNNLPSCTNVDATDPALDPQAGYDAGIQVTSGDLNGAKIVYNSNEPVAPTFGPMNELPPLNVDGAEGVGVPVNLQPTGTVFDTPVKIFIPCPGYVDVSALAIYYYNGVNWVLACDGSGVQPGGDGWIVPDLRVNHNGGQPPTIEIRVYHGSGAQAGTNAPTPTPSLGPSGDAANSGGGGGCLISCTANGTFMAEQSLLLPVIFSACILIDFFTIIQGLRFRRKRT